ncbi:Actin-related protein 10 [Zancudomyces culisetae]|uniref:Actin-related protein 10 n=1 Tax=Zancudomyces culisetae TaxID=1213189 RepID=A0A1R1PGH6_ZANCU|nr:Actin-related protein 10 [Zancudomyces culisetae]|eukprot:OMH80095.1 Actin-related protein 10 [Zancudomyces culisetae]
MEGLVVNIGYLETSVVPVFDGRPMYVYAQYSSIAGKALEEYLGKVLTQYGAYSIVEVGGFNNKLPKSFVTKKLCNHIIHNFIFASPVAPPKGLAISSESSETDSPLVCKELLSFYSQTLIASELDFAWELENSQAIRIRLPGWVREHILEVVFLGDPEVDKLGVTELVLRSIKAVPVDLRRTMASNLLITGGLADIPNIRPRLLADISSALYEVPGWNTLAESAKLAEESTEDKQTDGTPLLSSGIVFLSSDRAWIGTSLACSAGFNSTKATLDNLCTFSFS